MPSTRRCRVFNNGLASARQLPGPLVMGPSPSDAVRIMLTPLKHLTLQVWLPVKSYISQGATPTTLAWSSGIGFAIGLCPLLGVHTVQAITL